MVLLEDPDIHISVVFVDSFPHDFIMRKKPIIVFFVPLFICIFCLASAQSAAKERRKFQLGIGGQLALTKHELCTVDYDNEACQVFTLGIGPQIHGYYRFARRASLGILGSFWRILDGSTHVTSDGTEFRKRFTIWRTAVDVRLYPLKGKILEWWVAMELGVTGANDSRVGEALLDARRIHQTGFSMGLGTGLDFYLRRRLLLGGEFRAILLFYGNAPANVDGVLATRIGTAFWPVIGFLNLSVLF